MAVNKLELPPLPIGYKVDTLSRADYNNGALELLSQLTTVGDVSNDNFNKFVELQSSDMYNTKVIRDEDGKVVGMATLLVEAKLIHGYSKVGHVEDVVVDKNQRGNKLGLYIIRYLVNLAQDFGCYKVILDCEEKNVGFYEKCGLTEKGIEMDIRI